MNVSNKPSAALSCPGCGRALGRFAATSDTGELVDRVACHRTGATYSLQQAIPRPSTSGSKANKRRKSRRPIVIAQRRAEAAARGATTSKSRQRRARQQQRLAQVVA
jgi:hypothetical protein